MTVKGITLYEAQHAFTFVVSEDSDGAGYLSRDTFVTEGGVSGVDFLVGEIFAVVDGKAVKLNPAGTDDSEKFAGIAGYRAKVPPGQTMEFVGINQHATVRGADLTWPAGISDADKAEIVAQMDAALIKVR
jgi:hypothetical protein